MNTPPTPSRHPLDAPRAKLSSYHWPFVRRHCNERRSLVRCILLTTSIIMLITLMIGAYVIVLDRIRTRQTLNEVLATYIRTSYSYVSSRYSSTDAQLCRHEDLCVDYQDAATCYCAGELVRLYLLDPADRRLAAT